MTKPYLTDIDFPVSGLSPLFPHVDAEMMPLSNHWALMYAWP